MSYQVHTLTNMAKKVLKEYAEIFHKKNFKKWRLYIEIHGVGSSVIAMSFFLNRNMTASWFGSFV
jgi:hypothetical protein